MKAFSPEITRPVPAMHKFAVLTHLQISRISFDQPDRWLVWAMAGFLFCLAGPLAAQGVVSPTLPTHTPLPAVRETPTSLPSARVQQTIIQNLLDSLSVKPSLFSEEPQEWAHTTPYILPVDRYSIMGSYPVSISNHKTSHIIFPAKIKDFDAGSSTILALIPETATNVLRVKSALGKPFGETNMTILTEDGGFYSFLLRYDPDPEVLNINIINNSSSDKANSSRLGINQASSRSGSLALTSSESLPELGNTCSRLQQKKGFIRNVGATKQKCSLTLTGIYVAGKTMFFGLTMANASAIDYELDFIKAYLRDKDMLKRIAAQDVDIPIITNYPTGISTFKGQTEYLLVYALPLRTFTEDKVIDIELYERGGGRHLRFRIESDVMIKARNF